MRDTVTTLLDALGLLAVSAGAGLYTAQWIGWGGFAVAGGLVVGGVRVAELLDRAEQ